MIIVDVIGRTIQSFPIKKYLVSQENEALQVAFHLEKKVDDVDLENLNFRLDFQNETGNKHTRFLTKKVLEDKIELLWNVSSEDTCNAGKTSIAIVGSNTDGVLWKTFDAQIEISAGLDLNDFVFENKDLLNETINRVEDAFLKIESMTQGKSAYQIWLDKGNVGTVDDYLQSLKGAKGDKGDSSSYNPNLLINGDFKIWQRGTSFETAGGKYTADRWICPTYSHISKSNNGLLIKGNYIDGLGSISQILTREEVGDISGSLTCSFVSHNFVPINLEINIDGVITNQLTSTSTNFIKSSITFHLPDNFQRLKLSLIVGGGGVPSLDLAEIKWCKLEVGEVATPFVPRSYAQELALCQRYYNKNNITGPVMNSYPNSKGTYDWMIAVNKTYPTTMRILPTITPLYSFTIAGIGADIKPSTYARCYQSLEGMNYFVIEQTNQPVAHNYVDAFIFEADAEIY